MWNTYDGIYVLVLEVRLIRAGPLSHSRPSTADAVESAANNDRNKADQLHHRPWRPANEFGDVQKTVRPQENMEKVPFLFSATSK